MNQPPTPPMPPHQPAPDVHGTGDVGAPGRVRPRLVVAIVVAAVMLAGIAGLVVAAVAGNDDSPSSDRLEAPLDIDEPAVATGSPDAPTMGTVVVEAAPRPPSPLNGSTGDEPAGDEPVGDEGVAVPVDSIDSPTDEAELPALGSTPVELPDLVPPPPAVTTADASSIGELSPASIDALAGWDVVEQRADYAAFTDGTVIVELFAIDVAADASPADAGIVLARFLDDQMSGAERVTVSEAAPLGASRPEYTSVAGAEYVAVAASQQGTRTLSGAAVAAMAGPDAAVVVTTSREGRASAGELAADAELIQAVLAHVDVA